MAHGWRFLRRERVTQGESVSKENLEAASAWLFDRWLQRVRLQLPPRLRRLNASFGNKIRSLLEEINAVHEPLADITGIEEFKGHAFIFVDPVYEVSIAGCQVTLVHAPVGFQMRIGPLDLFRRTVFGYPICGLEERRSNCDLKDAPVAQICKDSGVDGSTGTKRRVARVQPVQFFSCKAAR